MKKQFIILPSSIMILSLLFSCGMHHDYQRKTLFNDNWKFYPGDIPGASSVEFNDTAWRELELPHDWAIERPVAESNPGGTANGYFEGGIGWYRKHFTLDEAKEGKTFYLIFNGIFMDSEIWLNGEEVGNRNYGYINQAYDISDQINFGSENIISIRVDNSFQPSDRWYHGCGIFRDVNLIEANPVHVIPWGTFIRNSVFDTVETEMKLTIELRNRNEEPEKIKVISHVYHPEEGKVSVVNSGELLINKEMIIDQELKIKRPDLWSPENPVIYECVTDILTPSNTILDTYITKFGVRSAEFTPEKGFVLNGSKLMMKGVCLHHDLGATGAAYYTSLMKRRLEVLKEAGVNAIRLSHNPYDPDVLDLCDRLGFVVMDELYDKWEKEWWEDRDPYSKPFMETWEKDLTNFVKRDRNHPSVVIWSAGNETMEQLQKPERGVEILKMLKAGFKELDPTRPVTCAMHPHGETPSRLIHECDVVSYNYMVAHFNEWREQYPEYVFLGSETKEYRSDTPESYDKLDFSKNSWFLLSEADAGQYIWTGIDYLGESKGWPDKGNQSGFINTCGFMKPYGYFQKSIYSEKPFVHITVLDDGLKAQLEAMESWQKSWYGPPLVSHWNQNADSVDVYIFTNLDKVEVYMNGELYTSETASDYPADVVSLKVPYQEGEIKAVASSLNQSAVHSLKTAGKPSILHADVVEYNDDDDYDRIMQFVVSAVDEDGVLCRVSDIVIKVEYEGKIDFLGSDNGDLSDHSLYTEDSRVLRDGRCLFIFKRKFDNAPYKVIFKAVGLEPFVIVEN